MWRYWNLWKKGEVMDVVVVHNTPERNLLACLFKELMGLGLASVAPF